MLSFINMSEMSHEIWTFFISATFFLELLTFLWNFFLVSPGTHVLNTPKNHTWNRNFEKEYEKEKSGRDLEE